MMKEKAQTLVTDQLYNLVAGFLYALSICYFAKGADFAPGGLSGLALLGNYLWGFPIGITTLVLNVPLILLGFRFVGRTFLGKTVISMLWCTFFQDVAFADQPGYGGDPLLAALFAGITWGGALALLYMRGSSSGGTDFLTMSIKVLRPHLSVGVVTGADRPCGHPVGVACVWFCRCRFVRSCHNGGHIAGYRQNHVRQQCRQNADDHHYQGAGNCGRNFPPMRARLNDGQSSGHIHRHGAADAALRLCQTAGVPHPDGGLPH